MIDVREQDFETIKRILKKHVPKCEVRAFGSRVKWTAKDYSDLDLAVIGKEQIPLRILTSLKEDLETAAISFRVDVLDWNRISESFRGVINEQFEIIQIPQGLKLKSGWRYLKVSDFAKVIGGGTPKTQIEKYWNGDIPWITPKDLSNHYNRYISKGERNISDEGLKNSSARILPPKTVLLTSQAPVGYVAIAQNEVATNQGFKSLVVKDGFDYDFIYYVLFHNTEYLKLHAAGSTFQELSGSTLSDLIFLIPPLPEQRAIAHILGTLDDKIELNRRMNETLEAMAHALFKSWFIDFDPVIDNALATGNPIPEEFQERAADRESLGDARKPLPEEVRNLFPNEFEHTKEHGWIPKGWKTGPISELADLNSESWSVKNAPQLVRYVDLANTKNGRINMAVPYIFSEAPSRARRALRRNDTIIGTVRPGNRSFAYIHDDDLTGSTGFAVMRPKEEYSRVFVFICLTSDDAINYFTHLADGAAYPAIRPEVVANFTCILPQKELLKQFDIFAQAWISGIGERDAQVDCLSKLRDTLLPKLISGEFRIPDAEKLVEEAV